jgi:hypothetical protein
LRDFKNESLFFKLNSCLFLAKREIVEFAITCDAEKIVRTNTNRDAKKIMRVMKITRTINDSRRAKTSLSSIDSIFLMMRFSIVKLLFIADVISRRFDFFAFVIAFMTRTINSSTYLFNQSLDQFIEIARKFSTIFIK